MLMWGYGVNQEVRVAVETPRACPQTSLNSQEYGLIADNNSHFPLWPSLHYRKTNMADVPLILCFSRVQRKI